MKIRRVDYSPDEFIAGVAGKLTMEELGLYWLICSLIYSKTGPIDNDPKWLARLFRDTDPRTVRAALDRLIQAGKVTSDGAQLVVRRCSDELEMSLRRVRSAAENGAHGGRPPKQNNNLPKPDGLFSEKLTINHQPSTNSVGFDLFWEAYPRKVGKRAAEKAWAGAIKREQPQNIITAVKAAKWNPDPSYIPHPTTWLNQDRWADQQTPKKETFVGYKVGGG